MSSSLVLRNRTLAITAVISTVCVGLGCFVYFQGESLPFYHDLQLLWWKIQSYPQKQMQALEKFSRLQKASKLVKNEILTLEKRVASRTESNQQLTNSALVIGDDIDFLFKNLDALHNLPHAEKRRKKELAKVLFDYGAQVDELQQRINSTQ